MLKFPIAASRVSKWLVGFPASGFSAINFICSLINPISYSAYSVDLLRIVQYFRISRRCLITVSVQTTDFLAIPNPFYLTHLVTLVDYF
jgi:hypothetical protein